MKKIFSIITFTCLSALLFTACQPDDDFVIGQQADRIQQLAGTWKLQNVVQTDLNARNNNFVDPSRPSVNLISQDITAVAPFTDMTVTFSQSNSMPSTFTINYGNAPHIFKVSAGNWTVDNVKAPGTIKFVHGTDTASTMLGGVNNLSAGLLNLQVVKYQGTKAVIQYNYNFKKN
jgi:kynureninase